MSRSSAGGLAWTSCAHDVVGHNAGTTFESAPVAGRLDHGSAWVTWLKCEQQQSACTALAHHELLVLTCCRRAYGRTCKVCKKKEHRSLQWRELFTNGFHYRLLRAMRRSVGKVPKADIGKCRCGVFLPAPQPTVRPGDESSDDE